MKKREMSTLTSSVVFAALGFFLFYSQVSFNQETNLPIGSIVFFGNDSIKKEELLKQMNSKPQDLKDKLFFWTKKEPFSIYTLEEDLLRLRKFYQQNGFIDPTIRYTVIDKKKKQNLEINIKESSAFYVGQLRFSFPNQTMYHGVIDSLINEIPLKEKRRFRDDDVIATEQMIQSAFNDMGYPYTQVEKDIQLRPFLNLADVLFEITPGNKSYFGSLRLTGQSNIPRAYILKHLQLKEGDVFSQKGLEDTQEELFDLGLFSYVTIRAIMDSVKNNRIPIEVQLKELPRWSVRTGVGYGTEDKLRVSLLLKRLSFLGGARSIILKGQTSYFKPLALDLKFIQPDIWTKNLDFILNPYFSREREESYTVDRLGSAISLQKEVSSRSSAYLSYAYGQDMVDLNTTSSETSELSTEELNPIKSGITFGYNINTSNNLFMPTRGWKSSLMASYMGIGFNSQYHYYKLLAEFSYYHPLKEDFVLAGKLKGGLMKATQGDVLTPIEDRFLMGGAMSLRGWGRNQISPVSNEGIKLGGNSLLEASAELRFPIYNIFSGTAFMDLGNTWKNSFDFNLNDLNYDVGIGLRINTPVGPIRADMATPLFESKFKPQFFVTIGHAF